MTSRASIKTAMKSPQGKPRQTTTSVTTAEKAIHLLLLYFATSNTTAIRTTSGHSIANTVINYTCRWAHLKCTFERTRFHASAKFAVRPSADLGCSRDTSEPTPEKSLTNVRTANELSPTDPISVRIYKHIQKSKNILVAFAQSRFPECRSC